MQQMRQFFFATRGDLLDLLSLVESASSLKYLVHVDPQGEREGRRYKTAHDIPGLGSCPTGDTMQQPLYAVSRRSGLLSSVRATLVRWLQTLAVDEDAVSDAHVSFCPGGVYEQEAVISSELIAMRGRESVDLYRAFIKAIKQRFVKSPNAYLGPEAQELAAAGYRLTRSIGAPPEYDWKLPGD